MVVADLVTGPARAALDAAGVSWLDRRGHLRIRTGDMWVDVQVPAEPRSKATPRRRPVSGPAQIAVASAALVGLRTGVRELARRVGLSAPSISTARKRLLDQGLVTGDGNPAVPELFWALADAWAVDWHELARTPPADDRLVLVGTGQAAHLGAPLVATADWPPELLGSSAEAVDRARLRVGPAVGAPGCRIGVSPTPLVADPELVTRDLEAAFPVAHPVFVALELAQDPARGAEALDLWEPEGVDRVW